MRSLFRLFAYAIVCAMAIGASSASFAQSKLNYATSWIGNSFGYGDGKWVQLDIQAITVGADGTIYTNAPWDESGSEIASYKNGDKTGIAGETHGWGNTGGDAIASNSTYLYAAMSIENQNGGLVGSTYPPGGQTWFGITRRFLSTPTVGAPFAGGIANNGNPTMNSFALLNATPSTADGAIRGLAATNTALYVSNTYANQIVVLDANTMATLTSWSVPAPGKIAVDTDGTLWVIQNFNSATASVMHYSPTGGQLSAGLTLPAGAIPVDLAISPAGDLLVADNGPAQQILVYAASTSGQRSLTTEIGTLDGMYHATVGQPARLKFNGITGIAVDQLGNLVVAQNGFGPRAVGSTLTGQGVTLQSYNYANKTLTWTLYGLLFVDGGTLDPSAPTSVYSGAQRFNLDFSLAAGQEWSYGATTLNRFKYPDDPALHLPRGVRGEPLIRMVNGQRLLFSLDQTSHYVGIYRFNAATDGETAIPSGLLTNIPLTPGWPVGAPTYGEWMWRDTNGDGVVNASEITGNPSTGSLVGDGSFWVDDNAAIWLGTMWSGIRKMPMQGFDGNGNPIYQYAGATMYPMPAPFNRIARIVYIAATDTMYVAGYTAAAPYPDASYWKQAGRVLVRYDNWSSGTPTQTWALNLPWISSTNPTQSTIGIAVAGNYVFMAEIAASQIDVYDNRTGQLVGTMTPGATVGNTSGWVDVFTGISATLRSNGEYVILVEDDARAKLLMYRWTPPQG
jgi:hypothetical protein